jgi:uncharacterized protein YjbI with pentapeptide repeats
VQTELRSDTIQGVILKRAKRYFTLRYATLRYATLRYATLRYATLRYATLRYATLRLKTRLPFLELLDLSDIAVGNVGVPTC